MFSYIDWLRNILGGYGTDDKAQKWSAGGHRNKVWLINSSSSPHRGHELSYVQCRCLSWAVVTMKPDNACHKKCLSFHGAFVFQTAFFSVVVLGSALWRVDVFTLRSWATSYPNFTVYGPDFVKSHQKLSGRFVLLILNEVIFGMSVSATSSFSVSKFQVWDSASIRWCTRKSESMGTCFAFAGLARVIGSQRSSHTFVVCPFPIFFLRPCCKTWRADIILFQPYEGLLAKTIAIGLECL